MMMDPSRRSQRPRQGLIQPTAAASSVVTSSTTSSTSSSSTSSSTSSSATSSSQTTTSSSSSASTTSQSLLSTTNSSAHSTGTTLVSQPTATSTLNADITSTATPSASSLIHTSVWVETTATVDGHATTFSTLVPTTLPVSPSSSSPLSPLLKLNRLEFLGILIGGALVVCALLTLLAWCCCCRRRKKGKQQDQELDTHRRGKGDGDDDDVQMKESRPGSMASSTHEGPYRYGAARKKAPASPGPGDAATDAFLGKDLVTIRDLKANKAGSASGSVFREELGDDGPGTSNSLSPSFAGKNVSHDRFSTNSSSAAGLLSEAGPAGSAETLNRPKRTVPPPLSSSPYGPASARMPLIFASQSSLITAQLIQPPGGATAVGSAKRDSLIEDEQLGARASRTPDSPVVPNSPSTPAKVHHLYHYKKWRSSGYSSATKSDA